MSKFDIILLFIFTLLAAICFCDFWLAWNGKSQLSPGLWTCATAVCAGEIVMFAMKRIAEAKAGKTKTDNKEEEDEGKTDEP